eukprot:CAMPEP_0177440998 /NCGR_PEP_ID=MMETSP0369-20130122/4175_1 /TAXON_ID=447022 ORGANISM="Scrippsiella hangoei-like, Strain SHHI-4" /NCGR_SAMPLE_ID=MMETSP0369 /ASSEMBLY_ACC=CAM_ASM_000364 /LENGTH=291 /DNA_ID=CAMNT_0018912845 /DNA_START=172 /DNA_END=1045 /DNA_ORIENTATION=-
MHAMCDSAVIPWIAENTSVSRRKDRKSLTGPTGGLLSFPSMTSLSDGKVEEIVTSSASATNFIQARPLGAEEPAVPATEPGVAVRSCATSMRMCCAPTAFILSNTFLILPKLCGSSIDTPAQVTQVPDRGGLLLWDDPHGHVLLDSVVRHVARQGELKAEDRSAVGAICQTNCGSVAAGTAAEHVEQIRKRRLQIYLVVSLGLDPILRKQLARHEVAPGARAFVCAAPVGQGKRLRRQLEHDAWRGCVALSLLLVQGALQPLQSLQHVQHHRLGTTPSGHHAIVLHHCLEL